MVKKYFKKVGNPPKIGKFAGMFHPYYAIDFLNYSCEKNVGKHGK